MELPGIYCAPASGTGTWQVRPVTWYQVPITATGAAVLVLLDYCNRIADVEEPRSRSVQTVVVQFKAHFTRRVRPRMTSHSYY